MLLLFSGANSLQLDWRFISFASVYSVVWHLHGTEARGVERQLTFEKRSRTSPAASNCTQTSPVASQIYRDLDDQESLQAYYSKYVWVHADVSKQLTLHFPLCNLHKFLVVHLYQPSEPSEHISSSLQQQFCARGFGGGSTVGCKAWLKEEELFHISFSPNISSNLPVNCDVGDGLMADGPLWCSVYERWVFPCLSTPMMISNSLSN